MGSFAELIPATGPRDLTSPAAGVKLINQCLDRQRVFQQVPLWYTKEF